MSNSEAPIEFSHRLLLPDTGQFDVIFTEEQRRRFQEMARRAQPEELALNAHYGMLMKTRQRYSDENENDVTNWNRLFGETFPEAELCFGFVEMVKEAINGHFDVIYNHDLSLDGTAWERPPTKVSLLSWHISDHSSRKNMEAAFDIQYPDLDLRKFRHYLPSIMNDSGLKLTEVSQRPERVIPAPTIGDERKTRDDFAHFIREPLKSWDDLYIVRLKPRRPNLRVISQSKPTLIQ